jgi:hypothetical protein
MKIGQLLLVFLSVFNIVSCSNSATTSIVVETSSATTEIPPSPATVKSVVPISGSKPFGFADLKGVVRLTKNAIKDGKLDEAETEFAKFEAAWQPLEDGVRSKSAENFQAVEAAAKSVKSGLASQQEKSALLANIQNLSQIIDKISKK